MNLRAVPVAALVPVTVAQPVSVDGVGSALSGSAGQQVICGLNHRAVRRTRPYRHNHRES